MTATNYVPALKRCLVHEGGWSNHPKDPGGATMRGVTQRVYDAYRDRRKLPTQTVRNIAEQELQEIYRLQYADKIAFDKLPYGLDYVVFDGAINSGPAQSAKWLQRALTDLMVYQGPIDGMIGNGTLKAISLVNNLDGLIARVCDLRLEFLRHLKTWKTFGKGWKSRVEQVGDAGQDWAAGSVPSDSNLTYVAGMEAKAFLSDAKAPPSKAIGDAATGAGTISVLITQTTDQLMPLSTSTPFIGNLVAGLTVAGVALTIGGIAWRTWQKSRENERAQALELATK